MIGFVRELWATTLDHPVIVLVVAIVVAVVWAATPIGEDR